MDCHKIDWQVKRLEELCQFQNGYSFKNKDYQNQLNDGYVVFRMGNINRGGGLNRSASSVYVSRDLSTKLSRFVLDKNDIVMCMTDMKSSMNLLGHTALIDKSDYYILNQRVGRITVTKEDILDYRYLFYYTNSKTYLEHLRSMAHSGVQVNLSTKAIQESPILLPPFSTQRKIAAVLSAYDDLIENNTRRIKILEEMASAIYREWFVEFRFPGHERVEMVESELGLIPQGWEVKQLGEVAQLHRGKSYRSRNLVEDGEGLPFLNLKNIDREGGFRHDGLKWYDGEFRETQIAISNDIIMALTDMTQERRVVARSARVPNLGHEKYVFSMDLVKIKPEESIQTDFLYTLLRYSNLPEQLKEYANGTTVLHLSPGYVQSSKLVLPPNEFRRRYAEIARSVHQQSDLLEKKNTNLRQTRNLLLPKLISGEIDVSELDIDTD